MQGFCNKRSGYFFLFRLIAFLALMPVQILPAQNSEDLRTIQVSKKSRYRPVVYICKLPEEVHETSGLAMAYGRFWTFNDSGGKPELYSLDTISGELISTLPLRDAVNFDWEDMSIAGGDVYIGDFGNNSGRRKSLCIYRFPGKELLSDTAYPTRICFSYIDQQDFNPDIHRHNFDCEAMINKGDEIVIFTKNWQDFHSRVYIIPDLEGNHEVEAVLRLNARGLITGADYDSISDKVFLIGYHRYRPFVLVLHDFFGSQMNPVVERIRLRGTNYTQTEGIWVSGDRLYISAEKSGVPQRIIVMPISEKISRRQLRKERSDCPYPLRRLAWWIVNNLPAL